ncbi:hypothetical protein [Roseateles chitinivorans]|uniref:hypothetical protein n=1 Tax=Roseateles chitinivorans TaxID=2917965 RepID=UPI003D670BFF
MCDELAELTLSDESHRLAAPDTASISERSQTWSWSSWGPSESRSTGSEQPSSASLASLAWLPSMSSVQLSPDASPWLGDFASGLPSRDDLAACQQMLRMPDCPGLSAAGRLERDWALALVSSYLDGSRQLPFMPRDEVTLLARVSAAMTRRQMALPRDPGAAATDDLARPPQSRQALTEIADWVDEARGAEGVRRERWLQYLTDRSFDPEARLLLPAQLLAQGTELPPESALNALLPPDSLADRGTLRWRGQRLTESTPLATLFDRLGVRHLDLAAPQFLPHEQLRRLSNADISAATLHHSRDLAPSSLQERIQELAGVLPSLYLVRLADQRRGVERAATPPAGSGTLTCRDNCVTCFAIPIAGAWCRCATSGPVDACRQPCAPRP